MRVFAGWVLAAGLVFSVTSANAQLRAPDGIGSATYTPVSDISGPYAAMPPEARPPRGPMLLPPTEVYTVLRESGFLPLGIPRQRGLVYTISAIDRGGEDGRLVIDARTGRIIRFMPAYQTGGNFDDDLTLTNGPVGPLPPMPTRVRGVPRPPASIPHVASRAVPVPKANPLVAKPAAEPVQQSATAQPKPADAQALPAAAAPTVGQVKPVAPAILPTQEMPQVQGLE
jgi:hypothetical protein